MPLSAPAPPSDGSMLKRLLLLRARRTSNRPTFNGRRAAEPFGICISKCLQVILKQNVSLNLFR